jgi:hypothetical protein
VLLSAIPQQQRIARVGLDGAVSRGAGVRQLALREGSCADGVLHSAEEPGLDVSNHAGVAHVSAVMVSMSDSR